METTNNVVTDRLVGIDVGGTKIEGVLTDLNGKVLDEYRVPARPGAQNVVDDIVAVVRHLSEERIPVGIGIPGQVDEKNGVVKDIVNLDIVRLDLADEVSDRLGGVPVRVENDVNAAALGAAAIVDAPKDGSVVFLNFGTGLAAGIVSDGKLEHGYSGALGEIGHLPVDPNGLKCACGQHGCLETVASGGAAVRLWPTEDGRPPMPDVLEKAAAGSEEAQKVKHMLIHGIVDTIQVVIQGYDPAIVAMGGGMIKTGQPLMDAILEELHAREKDSHFLETLNIAARLQMLPPEEPVGAVGAALAVAVA